MVEYYNLTKFGDNTDFVSILNTTDELLNGYFTLFLIVVLGIIIAYIRLTRNDTPTNSILFASFFCLMFAVFLYIAGIMYDTTYVTLKIFIPAIILVITGAIKWYETKQ